LNEAPQKQFLEPPMAKIGSKRNMLSPLKMKFKCELILKKITSIRLFYGELMLSPMLKKIEAPAKFVMPNRF